jgi:hypothetical protein
MRADLIASLGSCGPVGLIERTDPNLSPVRWLPRRTALRPTSWSSGDAHADDLHIGGSRAEWLRRISRCRHRSIAASRHRACPLWGSPQTVTPGVARAAVRTCDPSAFCRRSLCIAANRHPELLDLLIAARSEPLACAVAAIDGVCNRRGSGSTAQKIHKP